MPVHCLELCIFTYSQLELVILLSNYGGKKGVFLDILQNLLKPFYFLHFDHPHDTFGCYNSFSSSIFVCSFEVGVGLELGIVGFKFLLID